MQITLKDKKKHLSKHIEIQSYGQGRTNAEKSQNSLILRRRSARELGGKILKSYSIAT